MNRAIVRESLQHGDAFAFCSKCGERLALRREETIQRTREQQEEVGRNRLAAEARSRFEQAVFRVQACVTERGVKVPECFISYAWGVPEHERWVEKSLATDLQKAGIGVVLDRWENEKTGKSVPRFLERGGKADFIVVIGTERYRAKYDNDEPMRPFVVAFLLIPNPH